MLLVLLASREYTPASFFSLSCTLQHGGPLAGLEGHEAVRLRDLGVLPDVVAISGAGEPIPLGS